MTMALQHALRFSMKRTLRSSPQVQRLGQSAQRRHVSLHCSRPHTPSSIPNAPTDSPQAPTPHHPSPPTSQNNASTAPSHHTSPSTAPTWPFTAQASTASPPSLSQGPCIWPAWRISPHRYLGTTLTRSQWLRSLRGGLQGSSTGSRASSHSRSFTTGLMG